MACSRRDLLKKTAGFALGAAVPMGALKWLSPVRAKAAIDDPKVRWVFWVDIQKCVGCGLCVRACKLENDVPYDVPVTRTWVERYVNTKDGKSHIDTPMGGRDGYTTSEVGGEKIDPAAIEKAFFVPKLCNQCTNPPCVQVCPVRATFQTLDGIALVDRTWCIGCGYCIMACPYGVRFFHPVYKVADKCTFCYHRITKGLEPACVQACPFGARRLGNLKDPADPVARIITTQRVGVLKDEYGTRPQVFYIGLDASVR